MNLKDIPLKPKIEHLVMCPKCSSPLSTIDGKCAECGQEIDRIFLKPFDGVDWEKKFEDLRHEFSDLINKLDELDPDCVGGPMDFIDNPKTYTEGFERGYSYALGEVEEMIQEVINRSYKWKK